MERVSITLSNSLGFGGRIDWQVLHGKIVGTSGDAVFSRLGAPFKCKEVEGGFFVVSPKGEESDTDELFEGDALFYGFIGISKDRADSPNRFNLSRWIEGVVIIGELELVN